MGSQVTSPLYSDGLVLAPLDAKLNAPSSSTWKMPTSPNRFWATPRRWNYDSTREVIDIRFADSKIINFLEFEHSHFPHELTAEYLNDAGNWQPLLDSHGTQFRVILFDSVPYACHVDLIMADHNAHPEHSMNVDGHWKPESFFFPTIQTKGIRLVMVREPGYHGNVGPPTFNGQQQPYSLAVRNVNIGYGIGSVKDVPNDAFNSGETFASSADILGQRVLFSVYRERPSDILIGKTWRCEPQPISKAVVNFYADVRDPSGKGQIIDRFYMDPLYIGPVVNLYYSNDIPSGDFDSVDDPLSYPIVQPQGQTPPAIGADYLVFDGSGPSYVDIDNAGVQFDPKKPFWMGFDLTPHFDSDSISETRPIMDCGVIEVQFADGCIQVVTNQNETFSVNTDFVSGNNIKVFVAYLPEGTDDLLPGWYIVVSDTDDIEVQEYFHPSNWIARGDAVASFRIGGYQGSDPGVPNFDLHGFVLKQANFNSQDAIDFSTAGGSNYARKPFYQFDPDHTINSLIRFSWAYSNNTNPMGFVGGPGVPYENVSWTPVLRTFKMVKGYMTFPPIKARLFKFEITNLVAEPYEIFQPTTRKVKVFSSYQQAQSLQSVTANPAGATAAGVKTALGMSYSNRYQDGYANLQVSPITGKYGPTSALVSNDIQIASNLASASWVYGFQSHQTGDVAPRFQNVGIHEYETIDVIQVNKLAYFAGLKSLQAFKVNYVVANDTAAYDEHFHDDSQIADGYTWILDGDSNHITTPTGTNQAYAFMQSIPYGSTRAVKGVQFSAQQTDSLLLNQNDNFAADPTADGIPTGFVPHGDATLVQGIQQASVSRVTPYRWGDLDGQEYSDFEGGTYGDLERRPHVGPQDIGGISTELVAASDAGRVFAAARFVAPSGLTSPLYLQIVGEDESLLTEEQINAYPGQTVETKIGYTIGSVNKPAPRTYGDIEKFDGNGTTTYGSLQNHTYNDLQSVPITGKIRARLVQRGRTDDSWTVLALSIFDEGIIWEFSNDGGTDWYPAMDVRNNPYGVLIFPDLGTVDPHPTLMWRVRGYRQGLNISALRIRPWYAGLLSGINPTRGMSPPGPNLSPYDHYSDVIDDPQWKISHDPIPSWWYTDNRPIPVGPIVPPVDDGGDVVFTPPDEGGTDGPRTYFLAGIENITFGGDYAYTNRGTKKIFANRTETTGPVVDTLTKARRAVRTTTDTRIVSDSAKGNKAAVAAEFSDTFGDTF